MRFPELFRSRHPSPAQETGEAFKHLKPGRAYRVLSAFTDFDGVVHPQGESWVFATSSFLPYEDGLSLFVRMADGSPRQIRLQWRTEAQADVIDRLERYVAELPS